jgi:O-antigen/teichoic acid export membrane protein
MFIERLLPYWLLGSSVVFSLVLLGGRAGVPFIFGPAYAGAIPVLALLMVASCAFALFSACLPLVSAYGSTWVLSGICLISAVVNVALDLLLIPGFGINGSAVATVVTYSTSAVLALNVVEKKTGAKVLRLVWLATPALVACACSVLLEGLWFYPAALGLGAISVAALVRAFRLFRGDDAAFLDDLHLRVPFGLRASLFAAKRL